MAVYLVLRHSKAEQLWANAWKPETCLVEAITTDSLVAGQCKEAQTADQFVFVHRLEFSQAPACVVSKAKVRDVQKIDGTLFFVSFKDQIEVGCSPQREAEQGERSYVANGL